MNANINPKKEKRYFVHYGYELILSTYLEMFVLRLWDG
jgi:hypothetical protein